MPRPCESHASVICALRLARAEAISWRNYAAHRKAQRWEPVGRGRRVGTPERSAADLRTSARRSAGARRAGARRPVPMPGRGVTHQPRTDRRRWHSAGPSSDASRTSRRGGAQRSPVSPDRRHLNGRLSESGSLASGTPGVRRSHTGRERELQHCDELSLVARKRPFVAYANGCDSVLAPVERCSSGAGRTGTRATATPHSRWTIGRKQRRQVDRALRDVATELRAGCSVNDQVAAAGEVDDEDGRCPLRVGGRGERPMATVGEG